MCSLPSKTVQLASVNLMSESTPEQIVLDALASFTFPNTDTPLEALLSLPPQWLSDSELVLTFAVPIKNVAQQIAGAIHEAVAESGVTLSAINVEQSIAAAPTANFGGVVAGVKNIIAVASGKGGVGKSTTAVNLALALADAGASVGILDADIYGPSQPQMLGLGGKRPEVKDGTRIQPLQAHGVQMISMGNMVTDKTPMVWRGPMVSGALQQLLMNTDWQDVDYLIVDMPPGTGDIPLTLSQKVPVTGSVIVTTPQDIALLDAKKGIEMFRKVNIPVLGIVENMSVHICSNCGHKEHIFGINGGVSLAKEYDVGVLGQLPLELAIREGVDSGLPSVAADVDSDVSIIYAEIAAKVAAAVALASAESEAPQILILDD